MFTNKWESLMEVIVHHATIQGWNDRVTIGVLCDFIESRMRPHLEQHERVDELRKYLEERVAEEKSWCGGGSDEDW